MPRDNYRSHLEGEDWVSSKTSGSRQREAGSSLTPWYAIQNWIEDGCFRRSHVRQIHWEENGDSRDMMRIPQDGAGRGIWLQTKRVMLDCKARPGSTRGRWAATRVPEVLTPQRPELEWMVDFHRTLFLKKRPLWLGL